MNSHGTLDFLTRWWPRNSSLSLCSSKLSLSSDLLPFWSTLSCSMLSLIPTDVDIPPDSSFSSYLRGGLQPWWPGHTSSTSSWRGTAWGCQSWSQSPPRCPSPSARGRSDTEHHTVRRETRPQPHLLCCQSLTRRFHQQFGNKSFGFFGNMLELWDVEIKGTTETRDSSINRTKFLPRYVIKSFHIRVPQEGRVSGEENVGDDSDGPL